MRQIEEGSPSQDGADLPKSPRMIFVVFLLHRRLSVLYHRIETGPTLQVTYKEGVFHPVSIFCEIFFSMH